MANLPISKTPPQVATRKVKADEQDTHLPLIPSIMHPSNNPIKDSDQVCPLNDFHLSLLPSLRMTLNYFHSYKINL